MWPSVSPWAVAELAVFSVMSIAGSAAAGTLGNPRKAPLGLYVAQVGPGRYSFNSFMTKCLKPLRHLVRLSAKSSRSTNQNAPFGRLSTTCC